MKTRVGMAGDGGFEKLRTHWCERINYMSEVHQIGEREEKEELRCSDEESYALCLWRYVKKYYYCTRM